MVCGQGGHLSPVRLVQSFYSLLLDVSTSSTHCIHFNTNFYTKLFSLLLNVSTCSIRCRACKHCIHSNSNFHTKLQSLSFNIELANIVFIPEIFPRHQWQCWCLNFVFCVSWKFCWCQQKEKYHIWLYLHHTFHPLIYIAAWNMKWTKKFHNDKTSPWFSHSFFVFLTFVVPDLCFHRPWFSCSFLSISRFRNVKAASTTANMRTNYSANFSPREIFEPNLRLFLCWTFPRGIFIKDDSSTQKLSKSKNTSQLSRFKPDAHFEFCLCKTPLKN